MANEEDVEILSLPLFLDDSNNDNNNNNNNIANRRSSSTASSSTATSKSRIDDALSINDSWVSAIDELEDVDDNSDVAKR